MNFNIFQSLCVLVGYLLQKQQITTTDASGAFML